MKVGWMVAAVAAVIVAGLADAAVFQVTVTGTVTSRFADAVADDPSIGTSYRLSALIDTGAATLVSFGPEYGPASYTLRAPSFDYSVGAWQMNDSEKQNFLLTINVINSPGGGYDNLSLNLFASPLTNGVPALHGSSTPFAFPGNAPLEYEQISANFADPSGLMLNRAALTALNVDAASGVTSSFVNSVYGPLPSPRPFMGQVGFSSGNAALLITETAPVPEPATWALFISGFGLIGGAMRRRQPLGVGFGRQRTDRLYNS